VSPAELIGSLSMLGLNKSEAARLLGVTYRTVHRWTESEQEIPEAVALALRLKLENERIRAAIQETVAALEAEFGSYRARVNFKSLYAALEP
jgi:predicted site-specific integrase-resolvase